MAKAAIGLGYLKRAGVLVAFILGASILARVILVYNGGQYYFTDERRYDYSYKLYRALASGDHPTVVWILTNPTHSLSIWLGGIVVALQHVLAQLTPYGDWAQPQNFYRSLWLGALFASLFSSLNLYLLYRIALRVGARQPEAVWALLLFAGSNTAFYYSRHFLPYDCALSAALAAILFGFGKASIRSAVLCGSLAGTAYGLYNGYWYLVPIIWLIHLAWSRGRPQCRQNSLIAGCAAAFAVALPMAIGWSLGGQAYLESLHTFGASVKYGLFSEGWSLPWAYFWHSEGAVGCGNAIAIVAALMLSHVRGTAIPKWVIMTILILSGTYALLVTFSNGLHLFVVYARTVKPLVPLFCLLGGWSIHRLTGDQPLIRSFVAGGIISLSVLHFWPHFTRVFPLDVELAVLRNWGNPKRSLSVTGSLYTFSGWPVTRPDLALVNNCGLYPIRTYIGFPAGQTIFRVQNPLTYLPFQYECHTPREREVLRTRDVSIRLIKLTDPAAVPDDPPMSMLYQPEDRPTGYERGSADLR
ncbi:MAG: hypothetical protein ABIZ04_22805 [Opitutus sp.]